MTEPSEQTAAVSGWQPPAGWSSYTVAERQRAAHWKATSRALPDEAREPAPMGDRNGEALTGPLPFCLPVRHAPHNLLPHVREHALLLFGELDIPWHNGIGTGPSNHLLDSQVQCVNALTPMVSEPDRLTAALGDTLNLGPIEQIEPGRYLTFEYIGQRDYLGEAKGRPRRRGSRCTSVDAAFVHRAPDGARELVLLEWKYTESYKPDPTRAGGHRWRRERYADAIAAPTGPVRGDLLPVEALFDEPLYQLVRQQLLAHEIERDPDSGVDRARVAHVLSPKNTAYDMGVLHFPAAVLGPGTSEVWAALLRHEDRFVHVDPAVFGDATICSPEYVARYGAGSP